MTGAQWAYLLLGCAVIVGAALGIMALTVDWRPDRGHECATEVWRPLTEYREPIAIWRRARPDETPGSVEPDDAPAEDPVAFRVTPSPLARRGAQHMGDEYSTAAGYDGRHRLTGADDWRVSLLTTTQVAFMDVLADAGEEPPAEHGPREADIRMTRTEVSAEQLALDLEELPR